MNFALAFVSAPPLESVYSARSHAHPMQFVPPAFRNIQWKTYIIFAVFCVASWVQVFFTFHETKGRALEDISELFESGASPFSKRRTAKMYEAQEKAAHHSTADVHHDKDEA